MIPNYYALLGVPPTASSAEIKRAYRRLARQYHPDLHAQAQDEQIKRVNEAYEILSDAEKRTTYDKERQADLARIRRERELLHRQQQELAEAQREPKMTWMEGMFGFVRELKKGLHED
jgi:curved DNA-binding protein CbpA